MSSHGGSGKIPDRWLHCPRKASALVLDKFLAFKTPLDSRYDDQVSEACRFTPQMLFGSCKNLRIRLGLWIDLTNTSRFYDCEEVKRGTGQEEVVYVKLQCRGHGETPSLEQVENFINLVRNFISRHPLKAIGVHCTHGFNRTGFLIVSYMVEALDWSVEAACKEFARVRPPGIYKGDYLEELYRRYSDESDCPPPPPRPSWCEEFDDSQGNGNMESSSPKSKDKRKMPNQGGGRKRFRVDVKTPEFMDGINGVSPVLDQPRLRQLQSKAQRMCNFKGQGFPGSQPVSMDMKNIKLLQTKPYMVSWKADGTRYMMLILGENEVYCIDRDNSVFQVTGLRFVNRKDLDMHLTDTLLDGEMVIDRLEGMSIPRYLVYDVIFVNGMDVSHFNFSPERLKVIDLDIVKPRHSAMTEGKIEKHLEPFSVRAKQFFPVEKAESFLSEKFSKQLTHEPDGLIFQPSKEPYKAGQCQEVLKWKPASHNSVDFRLKIGKEEGLGIVSKKIGLLYVGGGQEATLFGKMKYSSAIKELDNKIVECKYDGKNWVFMRERTDKSFPNSYATAMAVCDSISYPVTKEYLLDQIEHYRYRHGDHRYNRTDTDLMPPPSFYQRR